jgi:two-component sensor histidine kinase
MPQLEREMKAGLAGDRRTRTSLPPNGRSDLLELDRRNSLAHAIVATVREPLIVLDRKLRVVTASRSFLKLFDMENVTARGRPFFELSSGQWDLPELRKLLQDAIANDTTIEAYEIALEVPNIGLRHLLLNARQVLDGKSPHTALLVGLEDITERRDAQDLKDTLQQKQETLLLELQHRTANSLQIIASILLLKARTVQSEDTRSHLHDVHKRVILVATVQRQLCTSDLADKIELGPYLSSLCEGLVSSMVADDRAITIKTTATAGAVKSDEAISFGLIVTELVINALKHAFPDGRKGYIDVDFVGNESDWRLSVSDNGVGRRQDRAEPDHVGLGTTIVEALARQLKATVEVAAGQPGASTAIVHTG